MSHGIVNCGRSEWKVLDDLSMSLAIHDLLTNQTSVPQVLLLISSMVVLKLKLRSAMSRQEVVCKRVVA